MLKRIIPIVTLIVLFCFIAPTQLAAATEEGFTAIFDGKSLKGWSGIPDFWSVQDGAITGQTTKEKPTNGNTFCLWRDGQLNDFELRLKFRIVGGNSGIQYRSKDYGNHVVGGYQADFDGGNGWTGTLYEERGRGVLAKRGQKVVIHADGKKENVGQTSAEKDILASVKKEQWNEYVIIAKGNHLIQKVNGLVTVDLTDNQGKSRAMSGILALQLHAGPPMLVQFKDIRIKHLKGSSKAAEAKKAPAKVKAVFASKVVNRTTPGHAVDIEADITGAKHLYLVVTDGGDGFGCDWADWVEPRLVDAKGKEKKLTELKWKSARADWGKVSIGKNAGGQDLRVNGKPVSYGIGAHAMSVIEYELPEGHSFTRFKARGALDNGGTDQGGGSSVAFMVFDKKPPSSLLIAATGGGGGGLDPDAAIAALDVHEELKASIFANEPMLLSPSNIDIDHRGRVWVCEIVNYRGHRGKRPEGDRILILSDTDGDGIADKSTVFYQGTDIDSPHGVCVLGTSDDKNTRAIVSAGDKVQIFIDVDGDLKADKKQVLFSGISGAQHDHGIHAFVFGPDGKLYFNFGNSGGQIKDADGKPIVDLAGNVVNNSRKPYQEGMVFRCNLDGSEFETVGWNFRNNWMATVDSFGSIWQSDNDDDGNRGVRINYVMEFGNYGYRDEKTGAGWNGRRPNLEKEIPLRHWHLNDPGVVPNLLQTGAGSPTGITVYEGSLLSKVFQNQVIHCDAGPNIVRAYPVQRSGAGYSAEMVNILHGARDNWFRPSDVSVAPDGSLIVADWYDPGVGGHGMRDLTRGRLFRLTPDGHDGAYKVPALDVSNVAGAIEALKSPNYATRYVAWQALHGMGAKALPALERMATTEANPRFRARAIWLMAKLEPKSTRAIAIARKDQDDDVRTVAIRAARQTRDDVLVIDLVKSMSDDKSAVVRRECAVALRHSKSADMPAIWAQLASHHDGKDRWYLEALGLASDLRPDECFAAWLKLTGKNGWNKPAGLDIVWRVRAKAALSYLPKAAKLVPAVERDRFVRSFDFHPKSAEKDAALLAMLSQ